jgi:hypothetical protein
MGSRFLRKSIQTEVSAMILEHRSRILWSAAIEHTISDRICHTRHSLPPGMRKRAVGRAAFKR